ncbi:MFS transporter [Venturia nashicola]|uniref:MFS transporter n=1 Tax=Venturia nashicola TaxID=86259 RepID=A0A4Z1P418_9PEZI|nr:MFS transporter [Venturia nashicola]TLD20911.1 MFS transporter [Venturia nashicola]
MFDYWDYMVAWEGIHTGCLTRSNVMDMTAAEVLWKKPPGIRYPTVGGYIRALERTGAWPLDDTWTKEAANTILDRLDDFEDDRKASSCPSCSHDCTQGVESTVDMVRKYLDGLCLGCVRDSGKSVRKKATNVWDVMEGHRDMVYHATLVLFQLRGKSVEQRKADTVLGSIE